MRILKCIFIAVFMAMLMIPLVFVDLTQDRVSVQENRMLAQRPSLTNIKNRPGTFIREFDTWFKDSTGFREWLISLYNNVDKNIRTTDVRYTDGQYVMLIGERGHRYFASTDGMLIPKFQGRQFVSDDLLANMVVKLQYAKTYLDNKGIPLVIMFCTDKESVYPEFYPRSIKRGLEPIQLDVITRYLQEHTTADVFNTRQALLAQKEDFLLYNVSSVDLSHYNQIGAFFAYRELMRHINIFFPEITPYELTDIDISHDKDGIPLVSLKTEKVYKRLDASFFDDIEVFRPFTWENIVYENTTSDLPTILFFRDSSSDERFIGKYIAQHFGKTIFIHYVNMYYFTEYIGRYKPDIVVFLSAERELPWFAECVSWISISQ